MRNFVSYDMYPTQYGRLQGWKVINASGFIGVIDVSFDGKAYTYNSHGHGVPVIGVFNSFEDIKTAIDKLNMVLPEAVVKVKKRVITINDIPVPCTVRKIGNCWAVYDYNCEPIGSWEDTMKAAIVKANIGWQYLNDAHSASVMAFYK